MGVAPKMGLFGPMKTLESARTAIEELPDGRLRASIEHDTLRGVTVDMLRWWFEHIDTFTTWNGDGWDGPPVPVYRFWHPYDHIRCQWVSKVKRPDGHLAPGSVIRIEENLGGKHPIRTEATVTRFDDEAFNFESRMGGLLTIAVVDHSYAPVPDGCAFTTSLTLGLTVPLIGPPLSNVLRWARSADEVLRAWLLHNVEESGETERFVPTLYAQVQERAPWPAARVAATR